MDNPSVAAVVVTYNRADILPRCLDAILAQEGAVVDTVLVVDNGSTDNTAEVLADYAEEGVVHLDIGANTGSAGGFHLGVYEATMRGYDRIWIMDDDVVPEAGALAALLDADRTLKGNWGFLSSVARWIDGSPCKPNIQKKGLFTFVGEEDYRQQIVPVRIAAMASLMLNVEVVRQVGLPIAEYFFYTDDYEYTYRVSQARPSYMVTSSTVRHEMKRNKKPDLATDGDDRMWRYRYLYRNDACFYRNLGAAGWAYLASKAGYTSAKVVLRGGKNKLGRLSILWSGIAEGLQLTPKIIRFGGTRVLFFTEAWGRGGIETYVMNVIRGLSRRGYSFEIQSAYDWNTSHDEEIAALGSLRTACFSGRMPGHLKRTVSGMLAWRKRLKRGGVDVAYVNAMDSTTLAYAAIAHGQGVPIVVAHSHNSSFAGGMRLVKGAIHSLGRMLWAGLPDSRAACSNAAGKYMFGHRDFTFVPNGIDTEKFAFRLESRLEIRNRLGIEEDELLVGSLGRLSYQKNPLFSVQVLKELVDLGIKAHLLLIGNGELESEVESSVNELGLNDKYTHISTVSNPDDYYSSLDVFMMPSVFEGFGYTLIEAQCSGLPCIVSEAIQEEACVTDLVRKACLSEGASAWATAVVDANTSARAREGYAEIVSSAGFSIDASINRVAALLGEEG